MVYKTCGDTIVARLEKGEEITAAIRAICEKEGVRAGTIQGLGAVSHAVVGIFDFTQNAYVSNTLDEDMEITALIGNITTKDGELYLHIHATLGDAKGIAHGGHLNEGIISATCELFIRKLDTVIERKADPETGINLLVL